MAIGYLVDVNNEEVSVEKNIGTVGLFLEQFDQPFTRETVAELLMGLYDSQLSDAKLNRIKLEGRIDELKQSIKITGQFLDNPVKQSPAFLQQQIETLKHEINTISDEVRQLRNSEVIYGELAEPACRTLRVSERRAKLA